MTDYNSFDNTTSFVNGDALGEGFWQQYFNATLPIGSVLPWAKSFKNETVQYTGSIPVGNTSWATVYTFSSVNSTLKQVQWLFYKINTSSSGSSRIKITFDDASTETSAVQAADGPGAPYTLFTHTVVETTKTAVTIEVEAINNTGSNWPILKNPKYESFTAPSINDGWVECNGQTLSDADSVYNGQTIPDLNGDNRFLRGNSTSGGTGGVETLDLSHTHSVNWRYEFDTYPEAYLATSINANTAFSATNNKPPYYEIVWIMRVK